MGIRFDMAVIRRRSLDKDFSFRMDSTASSSIPLPPPTFDFRIDYDYDYDYDFVLTGLLNEKPVCESRPKSDRVDEDRGFFNSRRTSSTLP